MQSSLFFEARKRSILLCAKFGIKEATRQKCDLPRYVRLIVCGGDGTVRRSPSILKAHDNRAENQRDKTVRMMAI